ncbi:thioredoxin domain-containing protein [Flavobacterium frigidarium]|uniref:thioredoxin domain-containing protein n=1 Tax=Flavobacterium frigidarium TaxID=99286 RepID=UPI0030DA1F04|tara:strand:+ start:5991 stop:8099 length:2109 start_codon:yes stop_codon:yes gene_type:complete
MQKFLVILVLFFIFSSCKKANNDDKQEFKHTNDLIHETSPYLLQHAHNPVNWKAWNPETLKRAKDENKLIIISVGYSACHWCHVMEEESFQNDSVAKLMNDHFISIKVDREERPDIDQIYMNAVQLMTGSGGWPLNCIALPDGRPIFGGTYFTKDNWKKVLVELSTLYKNNPDKAKEYADKLIAGIKESELIHLNTEEADFSKAKEKKALKNWQKVMDFDNGGLLAETKFPMPESLHYLLRYSQQNEEKTIQKYVDKTLLNMANGGIYDALGGGFCRYAVDQKWHIPHFEKMLYDNAQMVSLYADAYLVSKNPVYKKTVMETLEFVERELSGPKGEFYSSIDADSKDNKDKLEEGNYYIWTTAELQSQLKSDYNLFKKYYNVNEFGLWEANKYVFIKTQSDEIFAKNNSISVVALQTKVASWNKQLLKVRTSRSRPHTDDKTITSWNALMLKGYIDAYRVIHNPAYLKIALKNANFILANQLQKDGSLNHSYKNGKSSITGFAEDYAMVAEAYIALYQVTLDEKWLQTAKNLMDYSLAHFQDKKTKMFYFTSNSAQNLITRKMEIEDNVIPSSNSTIAKNLFLLGHYFSNTIYSKTAKQMLSNIINDAIESPTAYYNWLDLMLNYTDNYYEIAISGKEAVSKLKELHTHYIPNILIAASTQESQLSLLQDRYDVGKTYIYVCVEGACKMPETNIKTVVSKMK